MVSGSKSQRLLLPGGEMKMLGHFLDESSGLAVGEVEDGESIGLIAE